VADSGSVVGSASRGGGGRVRMYGIDAFIEDHIGEIAGRIASDFANTKIGDTPIEKLFYVCLWHSCVPYFDMHLFKGTAPDRNPTPQELLVSTQERLLDWRVDFVLRFLSAEGNVVTLAIECDGHDFHERTKEQAARDRSRDRDIQSAGYTVFRFTGSELYRDPMNAVAQVIEHIGKFKIDDVAGWGSNLMHRFRPKEH
jgi:very-short-patch-repair endonuclease